MVVRSRLLERDIREREEKREIFIKILIKHELKTKEKNLKGKLKEAFDLRTK